MSYQLTEKIGITGRTRRLRKKLVSTKPRTCSERTRIVTKAYGEMEGEPAIMRRAKVLEKILREMTIYILDEELIVGNRGSIPRAGVLFPELAVDWIEEQLDKFETRPVDPFISTDQVKKEIRETIPYWKGKTTLDRSMSLIPEETREALKEESDAVAVFYSLTNGVGHLSLNNQKLLNRGLNGIVDDAQQKLGSLDISDPDAHSKRLFLKAVIIVCRAAIHFARRYAELARKKTSQESDEQRRIDLGEIAKICEHVPANPARTFHEAVQSFWFLQLILQIDTNALAINPGRFDQYMYPFYKKDMEDGILSREKAQELVECLWIKLSQEINVLLENASARNYGGFPEGQIVVLGGVDRDGKDATNELTYICLDAMASMRTFQPNLAMRMHSRSPQELMMKAARVIRLGTGMPQLFNDESIIPAMLARGYSLEDARDYVPIGCVEPHSQGRTDPWSNASMLNLGKILEFALNNGKCRLTGRQFGLKTGDPREFSTFEDVMEAYKKQVAFFVRHMVSEINAIDLAHRQLMPRPIVSALVDGCMEKCKDIREGGAKYNFVGPQGVGIANVGNSLAAIKKLVFEDRKLSMSELIDALDVNFEGKEDIRQMLLNAPKYGNDDDYPDLLCREVALIYCREVEKYRNVRGGIYHPGLYPVSVHVPMGDAVGGLPDGRKARAPLADGISPSHGTDKKGPTAIVKSITKIDHEVASNGTLLNLMFSPVALSTDRDLQKFVDFLRVYVDLKGHHIQFNVISTDTLRAAQRNPEQYQGLIVRVAGYSAFFAELDRRIQDDIIGRTEHAVVA